MVSGACNGGSIVESAVIWGCMYIDGEDVVVEEVDKSSRDAARRSGSQERGVIGRIIICYLLSKKADGGSKAASPPPPAPSYFNLA